jgi:hypothetical protein
LWKIQQEIVLRFNKIISAEATLSGRSCTGYLVIQSKLSQGEGIKEKNGGRVNLTKIYYK